MKFPRIPEDKSQLAQFGEEVVESLARHDEAIEEINGQLPSVVEYDSVAEFPTEGERGKIYLDTSTNKQYRWAGTEYVAVGGGEPMQEILYSDLVALRNTAQLVPGMQYRIIDYTCTTTTALTHSANHQFDIIVVADDESTLNKRARAVLHEGDTYFANSDLAAWQIWYDIDNDQTKYAWADPVNGKGVIFRMIDEFNNDVPYDFKNIVYEERPGFTYRQWGSLISFFRDSSLDADGYYGWRADSLPPAWSNPYCFTTVETATTDMILYKDTSGTAITYGGTIEAIVDVNADYYTFCWINSTDPSIYKDVSVDGASVANASVCDNNYIDDEMSSITNVHNRLKRITIVTSSVDSIFMTRNKFVVCDNISITAPCIASTFQDCSRSTCSSIHNCTICGSQLNVRSCQNSKFHGRYLTVVTCNDSIIDDSSYVLIEGGSSKQNLHIHAGVNGSAANILRIGYDVHITTSADYTTDIYAAGSQEIILGGN